MTSDGNDQEPNKVKGEVYCRRAQAVRADIALFPEVWNVGYTTAHEWAGTDELLRAPELWSREETTANAVWPRPDDLWPGQAIGRDDPFVLHFRALAEELGMAIAVAYLEKWDGAPRDTVSLIDRHGEIVLTYAKVHLCEWSPAEATLTPGDDFYVCDLDTAQGIVKVGAMICYDRGFPESARILMLKGAELILVPNASDLDPLHLAQFRVRAYENLVAVAMAIYSGPGAGHSVSYDPIGFPVREGKATWRDTLVVEAGEDEGIYLAPFNQDAIRAYRTHETEGNAFRKPHRYGILTSLDVEAPFVRVRATGEWFDRTKR
jgi:predicted amidohydrolase